MLAWNVLKRALSDTFTLLGLSPTKWKRIILAFFLTLCLLAGIWWYDGFPEAKKAVLEFRYYWPCFLGLGAILLWNLWLAPSRLLEERLDSNPIIDKKAKALSDMEILRACLESKIVRSRSGSESIYVSQDRTYTKLMTRYCMWFPNPELTNIKISYSYLENWILNIVRTLDEYDFDEAVKLIKEAADKNYWPHFADFTMDPKTGKWKPRSKRK